MVDVARNPFPRQMQQARSQEYDIENLPVQMVEKLKDFAVEKPLSFAAWTFALGFVLGWRIKPW